MPEIRERESQAPMSEGLVLRQFRDRCPDCSSDNLSYGSAEFDGDDVFQRITCGVCGASVTVFSVTDWKYFEDEVQRPRRA
jgi:transcription elongation factor Elf1